MQRKSRLWSIFQRGFLEEKLKEIPWNTLGIRKQTSLAIFFRAFPTFETCNLFLLFLITRSDVLGGCFQGNGIVRSIIHVKIEYLFEFQLLTIVINWLLNEVPKKYCDYTLFRLAFDSLHLIKKTNVLKMHMG